MTGDKHGVRGKLLLQLVDFRDDAGDDGLVGGVKALVDVASGAERIGGQNDVKVVDPVLDRLGATEDDYRGSILLC